MPRDSSSGFIVIGVIVIIVIIGIGAFFLIGGALGEPDNKLVCDVRVDNNPILGVSIGSHTCQKVGQCGLFNQAIFDPIGDILSVKGRVKMESAGRSASQEYQISTFGGSQTVQISLCSPITSGTLTLIDDGNTVRDRESFNAV